MRVLLDNGALVDKTNRNRNTPLHLAASSGFIEGVRLLLDRKASILLMNEVMRSYPYLCASF
jgi:ankyrin repeat protein